MTDLIALDIETTGLKPHVDRIHGVGIAWDGGEVYRKVEDCDKIRTWLADPTKHVVGHNLRFDLKFLKATGWDIKCNWWCTKILAQLLNENQPLGLKDLSIEHLGPDSLSNKRELDSAIGKAKVKHVGGLCAIDLDSPTHPHFELIARYCMEDCRNTLALWKRFRQEAEKMAKVMKQFKFDKTLLDYYLDEAMPLEKVLVDMELQGIKIDVEQLKVYRQKLLEENTYHLNIMNELAESQIQGVEDSLYAAALSKRKSEKGQANVKRSSEKYKTKFNWQSSDHLAELIFRQFAVPTRGLEKTRTGKPSTSEAALLSLGQSVAQDPTITQLLGTFAKWKKNLKLLNTYTGEKKGLLAQVQDGRVYADYLQAGRGKEGTKGGTVTGRLSSRNPNMQNLPRDSVVKSFFIPDPGTCFIYFDYSQLELRLAAHLSQDTVLLEAYDKGLDLHQMTADVISEPRQVGKTVNFAIIYDVSPWRLAQILNSTPERCKGIIDDTFDLYQGYARYLAAQKSFMSKYGIVVSETGRVRRLPALHAESWKSKEYKHAIKQGYNFPIQGLGASITKRCMIELHKQGYHLVTQVHDSVVIQVPIGEEEDHAEHIQQVAESIYQLSVPLKVDMKVLTSLAEHDIITIE